jgi:hypothetical protein
MEKVSVNPTLQSSLPNFFIPKRLAIATQELIVGLCISMQEIKHSNSNVKLVAKHVILIAAMSARATSCSNMARVLSIHPRNIVATMV